MNPGRVLTPGLMKVVLDPYIILQEREARHYRHYVGYNRSWSKLYFPNRGVDLLVDKICLKELFEKYSDGKSLLASDCNLTTKKHAAFAKHLEKLEVVQLKRGKITNVALNALIKNSPNLKALSIIGDSDYKHTLFETPKPLPALKRKHLGILDLQLYSSMSGILNYIQGAVIDCLVLTPDRMDFNQLNKALAKSQVDEIEFNTNFLKSVPTQVPENLSELHNLQKIRNMSFLNHALTHQQLDELIKGFGRQMSALDLSGSHTLEFKDLELFSNRCPNLKALSLFGLSQFSNELTPCPLKLINALKVLVKTTPVQHIVLGWDNDQGGMYETTHPREIIDTGSLANILSEVAYRKIDVSVATWYPDSDTMYTPQF
jgi:hypothetical protein